MNDFFSFKLIIFHDICIKANLHQNFRLTMFFIMLKDFAFDYYYSNILNLKHVLNFDQICHIIKNYFENAEYKQIKLNK